MLDHKRTTHLEDECSRNVDVTLDMWPYKDRNDDVWDKLGVAPIQEKLVQHHLQWFGHIQQKPPEASVRNGILSPPENIRRGRGRPRLTWEEAIKKDLKE
jgi:hypothetical protein